MPNANSTFEVFELIEPQTLKRHMVKMLIGYLLCDPDASNEIWFGDMVMDIGRIFNYLDKPTGKDINEILEIVPARKFIRYLVRLFFGYMKWVEECTRDFKEMCAELHGIIDHLIALDE
jgi:hypothetical protein